MMNKIALISLLVVSTLCVSSPSLASGSGGFLPAGEGGGLSSMVFIQLIALTAFLVLWGEVARRLSLRLALLYWLVLPLALYLPVWQEHGQSMNVTWFFWAKLYTVAAGAAWFALCRWVRTFPQHLGRVVIVLDLWLNIVLAMIVDLSQERTLNVIAGALLCVSMPLWDRITVRRQTNEVISSQAGGGRGGGSRPNARRWPPVSDLVYDLPWSWILAYTVWNANFAYRWGVEAMIFHGAVLTSALVHALWTGRELWAQARVHTLGCFFMLYITLGPQFETSSMSTPLAPSLALTLQIMVLLLAVLAVFHRLYEMLREHNSTWGMLGVMRSPPSKSTRKPEARVTLDGAQPDTDSPSPQSQSEA